MAQLHTHFQGMVARHDQVFLDIAFTLRPSILISKDNAVLKLATQALKEGVLITADYDAFTL